MSNFGDILLKCENINENCEYHLILAIWSSILMSATPSSSTSMLPRSPTWRTLSKMVKMMKIVHSGRFWDYDGGGVVHDDDDCGGVDDDDDGAGVDDDDVNDGDDDEQNEDQSEFMLASEWLTLDTLDSWGYYSQTMPLYTILCFLLSKDIQ